jgi:hypothetical protein
MPRRTYPVEFTAELRGVQPASSFVNRETGEQVQLAPTLQVEAQQDDGSVELHNVRLSDRVRCAVKVPDMVRGLRVRVMGEAVMGDTSSWFRYSAVEPIAA